MGDLVLFELEKIIHLCHLFTLNILKISRNKLNSVWTNYSFINFSPNDMECRNTTVLLNIQRKRLKIASAVYDDHIKQRQSKFLESIFPFLGGLGNALSFVNCGFK